MISTLFHTGPAFVSGSVEKKREYKQLERGMRENIMLYDSSKYYSQQARRNIMWSCSERIEYCRAEWASPENTFDVRTCAVHACLDMHEQHAVYMISPDVGQFLEKSCMHERCAHELAFFQDLAGGKNKSDMAYFFFLPRILGSAGLLIHV
jgi:hypothetical protein